MNPHVLQAILALQAFHVAFLLLHDWIPLGRLNDLRALRTLEPLRKIALGTLVSSAPFLALLIVSIQHAGMAHFPLGLRIWLWIGYGLLFAGELQAWWVPYLLRLEPERAERYKVMFGKTAGFLPERNGISPNLLHVVLHTATLALLLLLFQM